MNALQQTRLRAGSIFVPSGVAPDQGMSMNNASVSAGVGGEVGGSVAASGVILLIILGIVVLAHVAAK